LIVFRRLLLPGGRADTVVEASEDPNDGRMLLAFLGRLAEVGGEVARGDL
jgi:hypothetical protein